MNLKEALEQVRHDQPHLAGKELRRAVRALRDQANAADTQDQQAQPSPADAAERPRPVRVGEAWAGLAVVAVGTQLLSYLVWGSDEPRWYDVLRAFLLVAAVVGIVTTYRNRGGSA